jgi:hypothetical protein
MYNVKANKYMYNVKAKPPSIGCRKCRKHTESNENSRLIVEEDLALTSFPKGSKSVERSLRLRRGRRILTRKVECLG